MAGHSKWANIQHRKGAQDKKRTILFSKICREIIIAAKIGGGNEDNNPRLKAAISLAKKNSIPNKNIENAIKRGTGEIEGGNLEEITFEGYGPGGVAVFIEASTGNRNRTVSDIRSRFTKSGGQLGESGSVNWIFDRKGLIIVDVSHYKVEDDLFELVLEAGADDLRKEGEQYQIYTSFESLFHVKEALKKMSVSIESSEVTRIPQNTIKVESEETAIKVLKLIEQLEELDDVMKVYANFDISETLLEAISDKV